MQPPRRPAPSPLPPSPPCPHAAVMPPPCRCTQLQSRVHAALTAPKQPSLRPHAAVTPLHSTSTQRPRRLHADPRSLDAAPGLCCGWQGGAGGWRAGWDAGGPGGRGWYEHSYSPKECLYGGVKNALRKRVGWETWRKVVVVWRKVVMTWRKVVKCWRKKFNHGGGGPIAAW